ENPPALTYADFHERISTFNEKACLEAAARLQIDGIMTTGTDQPVYTAAYVANKLGMPTFFSVETARKATHKMHMKKAFLAHGVPNVKHLLIDENTPMATYEKLAYPAVLKPLDSQGQRGIYKVESAEQAKAYLPHTLSFSREDHALMEEYYPNEEITVSCWVKNGLAAILTIADRLSFDSPRHIGISRGHRIPSK
ncbi:MAG TPA: carboxylate--amine ligase, partial [Eubacteriaceae bacterium]|nr:carboxylate--amine ligase [Eubacteriaceae bacterium]